MLNSLPPKWNTQANPPAETHGNNDMAEDPKENTSIFRPNLITKGSLADAFMICTEEDESPNVYNPRHEARTSDKITTVYTNGSGIQCGTDKSGAGTGVFYGEGDMRNQSIRLPNEVGRTNQISEMIGAKSAAEDVLIHDEMELVSDSWHVLDGLGGHFIRWEDEGYFLISNGWVTQITVARF